MAQTVTIRNKKTGEIKQIPREELGNYNIGSPTQIGNNDNTALRITQQRLQELQQNKTPQESDQPQEDFMTNLLKSRALPIAGGIAGGTGGAVLGGGIASIPAGAGGAFAGATAADVARKELAGLLGIDLGEGQGGISSGTGNIQSVVGTAKKGVEAAKTQAIAETGGIFFKLLKPGISTKFFSDLTDFFSKNAKGTIPAEVVKTRFFNETLPKALQSSGELLEQNVVKTGGKLFGKLPARIYDASELNFVRKQMNALGEGEMSGSLTKFIANDLARILKEEQIRLAPVTAATIKGGRISRQIPNMLRQLPFGRFLLGTGAQGNTGLLGLLRGGASQVGTALSRFSLPAMLQGSQE